MKLAIPKARDRLERRSCELSEAGQTVEAHGVGSALYARNLVNFVTLMVDTERRTLDPSRDDEILKATLVCRDGRIVNPVLAQKEAS